MLNKTKPKFQFFSNHDMSCCEHFLPPPFVCIYTKAQYYVPRMIIIYFSPHTTELQLTPADPIEIDFVVELLAGAN